MLHRYRFGLEWAGLLLFALIMLPNIIWAFVPAPADVLRAPSATPVVDMIGSIAQIVMIAALVLLRHEKRPGKLLSGLNSAAAACMAGYWLGWALYYQGLTAPIVILMLTLLPCAALLLFAADRRNGIALAAGAGFTLCHSIFAFVNFIM